MKLVEKEEGRKIKDEKEDSAFILHPSAFYSIHPAVRDGFLAGIAPDARTVGHEAARAGLTAALGESPGRNPSDPATLDLLEEIVHHTLQSGQADEAWAAAKKRSD